MSCAPIATIICIGINCECVYASLCNKVLIVGGSGVAVVTVPSSILGAPPPDPLVSFPCFSSPKTLATTTVTLV
jgi:hypothetical protein